MTTDMNIWAKSVRDAVSWLADESAQRRAWFAIGPEVDSPAESFMGFLNDAAVEEFLKRPDTGLNQKQLASLRDLTKIVDDLCTETNAELASSGKLELPPSFIDDPRWRRVIDAAKETRDILSE